MTQEPGLDLAKKYFSTLAISKARKVLSLGKVSLSFKKGSLDGYLITTGIIKEDRPYESKVVYKKRLEGTDESPLSTSCDCLEWTKEKHCHHTAALFMYYIATTNDQSDTSTHLPPIGGYGVYPLEYGTILSGPHELENAPHGPTYSTLNYSLTSKKTIEFPIPENLSGKLVFNIAPNKEQRVDFQDDLKSSIRFALLDDEGKTHRNISIFESIYLFNWDTGHLYSLPSELKEFFSTLRSNLTSYKIDDALNLAYSERLEKYIAFEVEGNQFDISSIESPDLRIYINNSQRKGYNNFSIEFFNKEDKRTRPPQFMASLTFEGGYLDLFRKKIEAYHFLREVQHYFETGVDSYKKSLSGKSKKSSWIRLISEVVSKDYTLSFDHENHKLYKYDNKLQRLLFKVMVTEFGDHFFRYSYLYRDTNEVIFQVSMSQITQGLSKLFTVTKPYGVEIFYNNNEIKNWNSRIRFERKQIGRSGWFDLELEINDVDQEVLKNVDLDNSIAITKDGVILLNNEQKDLLKFVQKYTKFEAKEEIQDGKFKKFILPFSRARIFELFELKKIGLEGALTEEEIALCERLQNLEGIPDYPISEHLGSTLRAYQKTGYNWLKFLHENKLGACLADDMGLGKTIQTIAFIESIYDKIDKVLIVCPVSLLLNWENEFKKFSDIDVHIFHGADRELPEDSKAKVILTSYGILKRELEAEFEESHYDVLVLDEVQHLKNMRSLGASSARKINADFRICLTGTPVENDLAEFFNIIDLSIPGIWGDLRFLRSSSTPKSRVYARKTAAPFILRRTKNQVLTDLPPKIENNVLLSFDEGEDEFYKNKLQSIKDNINNAPKNKKYGEILKGLLELRQSCLWQNHSNKTTKDIRSLTSTKVDYLIESLEQIVEEGHQVIVFSQFTTYLDIIGSAFDSQCWKYSRIDGSLNVKKRQAAVDEFQSGKTKLFLISLKAGGVGLNLTAASYVFIMDPWWNPAVESQAIDRAYRIGQKNTLNVFRPIIKGSVEEKVLKLQDIKRELFKELLPEDDEELFSGKLTMKDFEELFN
ncbi:DEAD/DEAH box helicase [Halobacteriovorax sp. XZX-3]|uniref:DEAD/DEAH box helicase n=1 Tax=unclassified Halobacteriovorax TaxID=2639665 RepID=UPI000CD01AAA|nr:DEAD/DEAH box helicase [Halobacteriovorax sp. DA5]POB13808.1 hypothetical protein C0Z22_07050 [Halobacteriovorax sp. DA5]